MVCTFSTSCTCNGRICCDVSGSQSTIEQGQPQFLQVSYRRPCHQTFQHLSTVVCLCVLYQRLDTGKLWEQELCKSLYVHTSFTIWLAFCTGIIIRPLLLRLPIDSCTGLISSLSTYGYCWIPGTCVQNMQWAQFLGSHLLLTLETCSLLQLSLQLDSWDYTVFPEVEDIEKWSSSLSP